MALLEIEGLKTQFFTSAGTVRAVDGVDYTVEEGETVAVVGDPVAVNLLQLSHYAVGRGPAG